MRQSLIAALALGCLMLTVSMASPALAQDDQNNASSSGDHGHHHHGHHHHHSDDTQ
jgi:hypothetical protein